MSPWTSTTSTTMAGSHTVPPCRTINNRVKYQFSGPHLRFRRLQMGRGTTARDAYNIDIEIETLRQHNIKTRNSLESDDGRDNINHMLFVGWYQLDDDGRNCINSVSF